MSAAARGKFWLGVGLGIIICLAGAGGFYLSGYHFMYLGQPGSPAKIEKKAHLLGIPQEPGLHPGRPGQGRGRQRFGPGLSPASGLSRGPEGRTQNQILGLLHGPRLPTR